MVPAASNSGSDISLRDILVHIQSIGTRLDRLEIKIEEKFDAIEARLGNVENDIHFIKADIRFMKTSIENIDARLDTIEMIPSILKHIKSH
jgi:archaellum component FlaC